jgi:uncharacterized FlaG/YvyC family protein
MSISPISNISTISTPSVQPNPTPVVGQAAPETDPTASSGSPPATPAVQAGGAVGSSGSTVGSSGIAASSADATKAADALQNSPAFRASDLSFSTDKESGLSVVTVTDTNTKQVLLKIPTDAALAMTHAIDSKLRGNLIDHKA